MKANGLSSVAEFPGEGAELIIPLPKEKIRRANQRHRVERSEYLGQIADMYGVAWQGIVELNCLAGDGSVLHVGQMLLIP